MSSFSTTAMHGRSNSIYSAPYSGAFFNIPASSYKFVTYPWGFPENEHVYRNRMARNGVGSRYDLRPEYPKNHILNNNGGYKDDVGRYDYDTAYAANYARGEAVRRPSRTPDPVLALYRQEGQEVETEERAERGWDSIKHTYEAAAHRDGGLQQSTSVRRHALLYVWRRWRDNDDKNATSKRTQQQEQEHAFTIEEQNRIDLYHLLRDKIVYFLFRLTQSKVHILLLSVVLLWYYYIGGAAISKNNPTHISRVNVNSTTNHNTTGRLPYSSKIPHYFDIPTAFYEVYMPYIEDWTTSDKLKVMLHINRYLPLYAACVGFFYLVSEHSRVGVGAACTVVLLRPTAVLIVIMAGLLDGPRHHRQEAPLGIGVGYSVLKRFHKFYGPSLSNAVP